MTTTFCPYKDICAGCQLLNIPYEEQGLEKIRQLKQLLNSQGLDSELQFHSEGASQLRDRLDFSYQDGALGLYSQGSRQIVDIEVCAQLSPKLQEALEEFRKIKWPVSKASFRLRVSPQGKVGVWIDMANIDIKRILEEKNILQKLQQWSFVEMGQRRKVPVYNGNNYKLYEPELHPWFETSMGDQRLDLYCQVASFTQPSLKANQWIAQTISKWVGQFPNSRVLEFGSGIGNLTFPALSAAASVTACEIDELSLEGLARTRDQLPKSLQEKAQHLHIFRGDFQRKLTQDFAEFDLVLANPPRSGLMNFLNPLEAMPANHRPQGFIYMSCYPESLVADLKRLKECGYEITEMIILDQFPQTHHYEVLTLLQRK